MITFQSLLLVFCGVVSLTDLLRGHLAYAGVLAILVAFNIIALADWSLPREPTP